jgi:glycosyltransferase involved in cell wall biosynthesis
MTDRSSSSTSGPEWQAREAAVQLTIVIPALNEEEAIGGTIERCLAARGEICRETGVTSVRIVVVSDGSTDRTPEIARSYAGVDVVVFPQNRGYGAAIKAGWEHGGGELLAFLDADGTCDPRHFVPMCRELLERGRDVVLGCRMGGESRMPAVRRLGNTLFALLLGLLAHRRVRDTASGMRVVRRQALPRLLPLPDGLHFTPAMSARALMADDVEIAEIDMPYDERIGESKLHALRDGVRFLKVILSAAAYVKVSRLTLPLMVMLSALCAMLLLKPVRFYLAQARLEEWHLYRIALAGMLGTIVTTILCATIVSEHLTALTHFHYQRFGARARGLWRYGNLKLLTVAVSVLWLGGALLNLPGLLELLRSGHVTLHWSRVMLGAFVSINLAQLLATLATLKIVRALHLRQPFLRQLGPEPDDTPP